MSVDNPVFLIDKVVRGKIFNSAYYKEKCFGLNAETLIDRAVELKAVGGTFGGVRRPTPFLCLVFKLLQIAPEFEIVEKYMTQTDFKYLRAVGAMYCRLVGKPVQVYKLLEPYLADFSKLKRQLTDCSKD
jgi:pre-mRNA-splicing factor 38A